MFQNIWVENSMERGRASVKEEAWVTLLAPSAVFYLDLFKFPFRERYLSVCLKAASSCSISITMVLCFCETSQEQWRSDDSFTALNCNLNAETSSVSINLQWALRTSHLEKVSQELFPSTFRKWVLALYPFHSYLTVRFAVKQEAWALLNEFHTVQYLASM